MKRRIPEQVYRSRKIYKKGKRKVFDFVERQWCIEPWEYGFNAYLETTKEGKTYIKYWHTNSRKKFVRNTNNRKLRRFKGDIPNGGAYRKVYEFDWEVD